MSGSLFAYGTLQLPEVLQAVAGRDFPGQSARLQGYACYALRGQIYPGIRPWPGAVTAGILYGGLDAAVWRQLDAYEDAIYRRKVLTVLADDGQHHEAAVYVVRPACYGHLSARSWSVAAFRRHHLQRYLAELNLSMFTGKRLAPQSPGSGSNTPAQGVPQRLQAP